MRSYRPFTVLILLIAAGLMTACLSGPQEPYTTESGLTIQIMKAGLYGDNETLEKNVSKKTYSIICDKLKKKYGMKNITLLGLLTRFL